MSYRLWTCGKMIYGQKGDNSLDMRALEKMRALRRLMNELEQGKQSGEERGWLTLEEAEKRLSVAKNKGNIYGADPSCSAPL